MGIIRVLPQAVINKIAAGEVIERPASVLKELLENSLDAGATRIEIEIEEGGRKLIRVTDNGQGMDAEDVALAFESHSTSKLRDSSDLFFITTMGFRGEALPSIAAVSQTRLVSRLRGAPSGAEITVSGGQKSEARACGAAEGTTVEVRNLFHNLPARRKFLKSIPTETAYVVDMITHIALSRPDVHFVLARNQKEIINAPAAEDRRDRLASFFGAELAEQLIPVDGGEGPVRVVGFVAPPTESRANQKLQMLFLNRRFIRDKTLVRAVMDAYAGLLSPGRFPPVFLFVQMDPREVDVNVSPTKLQVRFSNSQQVYVAVRDAVGRALASHDIRPHVPLPGTESAPPPTSPGAGIRPFTRPQYQAHPLPLSWAPTPRPTGEIPGGARTPESVQPPPVPPARRSAQFRNTFIVLEQDSGLEVIDQHALHERIVYEAICGRLADAPLERQRLLAPAIVELSRHEIELLTPAIDAANELGIELAAFGERSFAVHSLPQLLSDCDPAALMRDLLDELTDSDAPGAVGQLREQLIRMIACKAAVKAGQALSEGEIASLLLKREHTERPESCPHGRPTSLRLSWEELEKYFKRT